MPAFAKKYRPQLAAFAKTLVGFAGTLFVTVLAIVAAVTFAAITLAYSESARAFILSILARITGSRENGEHYMSVIGATIKSVANGVIGVAFVQALLCGIGFFVIGVPGAAGHRAYFGGSGTGGQQVVVVVIPPAQLTDSNGDTIDVLALTLDNGGNPIRTIDPVAKTFFVGVGCILNIAANQPEGDYSATFQVTANYQ